MRERPDDEFLPDEPPQLRKAVRLDDQKEDDQPADDHHVEMLDGGR